MSTARLDSDDKRSSLEKRIDSNSITTDIPELAEDRREDKRGFWDRLFRPLKHDPDAIATQPSVFDDPKSVEIYRPPPSYENAHRFDPKARWTWKEDRVSVYSIMHF